MMCDVITKAEVLQRICNFKENANGHYFLPIPYTITSKSSIVDAYLEIGRGSTDCEFYYDGIAFREDLYDLLISFGISDSTAYGVMERVRKGLGNKVDFDNLPVPQLLKEWCLSVKYLPSRRIVLEALSEKVNNIADKEAAFREALLDTLPRYKYTPMTFIGSIEALNDIKKKIYEIGKKKKFLVDEEDFETRNILQNQCAVNLVTICRQDLRNSSSSDDFYISLCKIIEDGIPLVILVERDFNYVEIEKRIKSLLCRGVVCQIGGEC